MTVHPYVPSVWIIGLVEIHVHHDSVIWLNERLTGSVVAFPLAGLISMYTHTFVLNFVLNTIEIIQHETSIVALSSAFGIHIAIKYEWLYKYMLDIKITHNYAPLQLTPISSAAVTTCVFKAARCVRARSECVTVVCILRIFVCRSVSSNNFNSYDSFYNNNIIWTMLVVIK